MTNNAEPAESFDALKARLEEIVQAVSDESLPLDAALDLYEEAVSLGMRASDYLEDGILLDEETAQEGVEDAQPAVDAVGDATAPAATVE